MEATLISDISLKPYNTLRLEATASKMIFPHSQKGLVEVMKTYQDKKIIIIGKGSNTLFRKIYYDDDYIFLNLRFLDKMTISEDRVSVECGATLSDLVWYSLEYDRVGLEFLEDIPGTVGGAVIMNAGTYKDYIGDLISSVTYYDIKNEKIIKRETLTEDFGRRKSFWTNKNTVLISCSLNVRRGNYLDSLDKIQQIKKNRFKKQPRNFPSAGSVFIRPKIKVGNMVVWELLDKVGLRGQSHGGAAFSEKHPGFIINLGNATYSDINFLIELAIERVFDKFGIKLQVEWESV